MNNGPLSFGPFEIDATRAVLTRQGVHVPVGPRAVAVLAVLAAPRQRRDQVRSGRRRLERPRRRREHPPVQIANLRRALGPGPSGEPWITTLARVGYRLADVSPPGPSARDLYLRGRALVARWSELNAIGRDLLVRALAADGANAPAQAWLSQSHHFDWMFGPGASSSRALAVEASRAALAIDPADPDALWSSATVRAYGGDLDGAFDTSAPPSRSIPTTRKALALPRRSHGLRRTSGGGGGLHPQRLHAQSAAAGLLSLAPWLRALRCPPVRGGIAVLDTPALRHSGAQRILAAAL